MADNEEMDVQEEVVESTEELTVQSALKQVLQRALAHNGLRRGLHECAKELERGNARLCILAQDCDNAEYTKLIQALCTEKSVPLIMSDKGVEIAEWVGLAKLNADGTVRKVKRTSVAVISDFGEDSLALNKVLEYVQSQQE
jgi:small subunit ribosomal protein S12e